MPISVAIITKNEENRLPDCLHSVSFADEIIVVDACSNDNTVQIAQSLGAKVFVEPWRGFSTQKQLAVNHCTNKWVLILDADERVPPETASRIIEITKEPRAAEQHQSYTNIGAYSLRRKNYLHGRWIKSCGWWPNSVVRLVDKSKGAFDGKNIHESWLTEYLTIELKADIDHLSFNNYSDLIKKMDHYSDLGAASRYEQKININPFIPIAHGCWMFLKTYFLELGCADGFDGFVISMANAGGSFLKYAKHLERVKFTNKDLPHNPN